MALGDFKKVAFNSAVLGAALSPIGGVGKSVSISSSYATKISALCTAN